MAAESMGFSQSGQDAPIDGTVTGSTVIYSVGSLYVSPMFLTFETISSDSITETAIVSIGTNSPNYDDILSGHGLQIAEGAMETVQLPISRSFQGPLDVYVRVVREATGTEFTFTAGIGYLAHGFN